MAEFVTLGIGFGTARIGHRSLHLGGRRRRMGHRAAGQQGDTRKEQSCTLHLPTPNDFCGREPSQFYSRDEGKRLPKAGGASRSGD